MADESDEDAKSETVTLPPLGKMMSARQPRVGCWCRDYRIINHPRIFQFHLISMLVVWSFPVMVGLWPYPVKPSSLGTIGMGKSRSENPPNWCWYMHTYMTGWCWTRANVGTYSSTMGCIWVSMDSWEVGSNWLKELTNFHGFLYPATTTIVSITNPPWQVCSSPAFVHLASLKSHNEMTIMMVPIFHH